MRRRSLLALTCLVAFAACEDLEARCVDGTGNDGGASSGGFVRCGTQGGDLPTVEGQLVVACGAEIWAVRTCGPNALSQTECEDRCAVVEKAAAVCNADGKPECEGGGKVSCEYFPIPSVEQCDMLLGWCDELDEIQPMAGATAVAGCVYDRGLTYQRDVNTVNGVATE